MSITIEDIQSKEIVEGIKARFIHSDNFTLSYVEIEAGSILPEHTHVHEQVSHVTEGEFEFTIGGKTQIFTAGTVVIIPSNVKHSGKAITACKITDTFYPIREDYKALN